MAYQQQQVQYINPNQVNQVQYNAPQMQQMVQYPNLNQQPQQMATGFVVDIIQKGQAVLQQGLLQQNLSNPLDPLSGIKYLKFTQQPQWIECMCPCFGERSNQYTVHQTNQEGNDLQIIGNIQERSECCSRIVCQCWRPFQLTMYDQKKNIPIFQSIKKCSIPAACLMPCERPELRVDINGQYIGRLHQPFLCCGRSECPFPVFEEIDVYDSQNNLIYYISAEYCQLSVIGRLECCPRCCCGECQQIIFDIYNPLNHKVGHISNVYNGCCNEVFSKADKFIIKFPDSANYIEKILLMNAVLTIDYDHFESTFCNQA